MRGGRPGGGPGGIIGRPGGGPGGSLMPVGKRCGGADGLFEGVCVEREGRVSVVPARKKYLDKNHQI